jgi:hypothetical protein
MLTQGQSVIIDAEDYSEVSKYKWCAYWDPTLSKYIACE